MKPRLSLSYFIRVLFVWMLVTEALVNAVILMHGRPEDKAVIKMGDGLILLWILMTGGLIVKFQHRIIPWMQGLRGDWRIKFVVMSTALLLWEEAITTAMTNLAPLFGVRIGQAYITASSNYFDVIFFHSVIVIAPMYIGWAILLSRYDFTPAEVFLLFGITGTLAEASFGGMVQIGAFGFWIFVYGLMVWLPAKCIPHREGLIKPKWYVYVISVLFPNLFSIPFAIVVHIIHPSKIDFPPYR
jgi:hypothetical protein